MSSHEIRMASRAALMQRLANLSTEGVCALLDDERILDAASAYFARADEAEGQQVPALSPPDTLPPSPITPSAASSVPSALDSGNKRTRPVNAFVAFRSYYVKMFPGVPQKARSGFLTKLWSAEPFRNRWVLIAKVYSFVRDEMGKGQTKLSYFLQLCCPLMGIVDPQNYLDTFGWVRTQDEDENPNVVRADRNAVDNFITMQQTITIPTTELELLARLVEIGYLPEDGYALLNRMNGATNGIMTTAPPTSNPAVYNVSKLEFMNTIRSNPEQAASELIQDSGMDYFAVRSHDVDDLTSMGHLPMNDVGSASQREPYNYVTNHSLLCQPDQVVMDLDSVADHEVFDIDSPWDMDTVLHQTVHEGSRAPNTSNTERHDPRQDFHFGF